MRKAFPARSQARTRLPDPAKDAARLLRWFGFGVMMVAVPLIGLLSRRALFVLLPLGGGILAMAAAVSLSDTGLRAFRRALASPLGLTASFLAGWTALSCIWTAFPSGAAPLCAEMIGVVALAALVIAHVPEQGPQPSLYLLPGGLAATAVLAFCLLLMSPPFFLRGTEFEPSLLERTLLTLVVLSWPALGALAILARWRWAAVLAVTVAAVAIGSGASLGSAAFAVGAVSFGVATERVDRTARALAIAFAGALLLGPTLPFILGPLAQVVPGVGRGTAAAMADWRHLVSVAPVRLITGHGLDSARRGVIEGLLPPHAPRTILFTLWYDLGLLGVLGTAAAIIMVFTGVARAAPTAAPFLLGGIASVLTIEFVGVATAEIWYVTLVCLQAIAFGLLARSNKSGTRPTIATRGGDQASVGGLRHEPFVAADRSRG